MIRQKLRTKLICFLQDNNNRAIGWKGFDRRVGFGLSEDIPILKNQDALFNWAKDNINKKSLTFKWSLVTPSGFKYRRLRVGMLTCFASSAPETFPILKNRDALFNWATSTSKQKSTKVNFSAFNVTPSGFKPETFWSVVRCSIQLSYGAIFPFGVANIGAKF